jgi:hypothetical protein
MAAKTPAPVTRLRRSAAAYDRLAWKSSTSEHQARQYRWRADRLRREADRLMEQIARRNTSLAARREALAARREAEREEVQ